jgi:predicted ArsR family transcriptional regulator
VEQSGLVNTMSVESSDAGLLNLLRQREPLTVSDMAAAMDVTPTAVRQRLNRVMGSGLVEREACRAERGRPSHRYRLTAEGRKQVGNNFADLAMVLWHEIRSIQDPSVRKGLLQRVAKQLGSLYGDRMHSRDTGGRMEDVSAVLGKRNIPCEVEKRDGLPALTILACPYPSLAEADRGVCAMEKMLISELLHTDVHLAECRLDGGACCTFQTG